jgi:CheY-like chemotaxis protein
MPEKRVLIVEDDPSVRGALADALACAGVQVTVAADGAGGLECLCLGPPPSVILLDVRARRCGGEELLRALRADRRFEHVPVVTMTTGRERSNVADAVADLHAPFDSGDLVAIVLSLFEADAA